MESPPAACAAPDVVRVHVRVRGQVQGVGFRPFVYRLASELGLSGFVRNDTQGVEIEVQGPVAAVERFKARLPGEAPALARIDGIECRNHPAEPRSSAFLIEASRAGSEVATGVVPDTSVCPDCLDELFDPADRRHRYPFINCTHCGPRFTITARIPYDRPNTSMARFALCPACRAEYDDPLNRRFHAQPNACPLCGPRLWLADGAGGEVTGDPVAEAVRRLRAGEILAVKGLGGFHLACDARNGEAVARLRERKQREEKPFAVMACNAASLHELVALDAGERALLESAQRPVVLLRKRAGCDARLPGIAPAIAWLGAMLPYAPVHFLLFHEAAGRPEGRRWLSEPQDLVLVMTSANPLGEPLAIGNDEALDRLSGIADAFLLHDRDILVRCDDSVVRSRRASPAFVRRARGFTPASIRLPRTGPSVLACGGFFKNTVCVTRGDEAFVSQHIGELDNRATCVAMEETVRHLLDILQIEPACVAHDLHPDLHATRFAIEFARTHGLPAIGVQHHHAHVAAVVAEHRHDGPVLGLALDGVGLGSDGGAWGGELLRVEGGGFSRLGSLAPLALPGGDRAAREPWRMAAAALHACGRGHEIEGRFARPAAAAVREMLQRGVRVPATSSAGRLFDAAAGLLGVRLDAAYEGQAAMMLEGAAANHGEVAPDSSGYTLDADGRLSFLPLLARLAAERDPGYGAALFHATLAQGLAQWAIGSARRLGLDTVALGGGCFLNDILSSSLRTRLNAAGLAVLEARAVPPNDGGLSLGQAWVALNREW